jgi:lipopolysaccharide/colanic/teichoic acid biosynthesis glycosyltransferase
MIGKRIFDIFVSFISLIILSLVLIIAAVIIKLESKGSILYKQIRVGLNGKPFYIYKFRTMEMGADKNGPLITSANDLRMTRTGRFLRKIKLDEMPQLFNVLKGEMSIVGPRPEVPEYVKLYTNEQKRVLTVKPGMTDPATVYFRNEERLLANTDNKESFYIHKIMPVKLKLYLRYIDNMSLVYDIKLILLEFFAIILPEAIFSRIFINEDKQSKTNKTSLQKGEMKHEKSGE